MLKYFEDCPSALFTILGIILSVFIGMYFLLKNILFGYIRPFISL